MYRQTGVKRDVNKQQWTTNIEHLPMSVATVSCIYTVSARLHGSVMNAGITTGNIKLVNLYRGVVLCIYSIDLCHGIIDVILRYGDKERFLEYQLRNYDRNGCFWLTQQIKYIPDEGT